MKKLINILAVLVFLFNVVSVSAQTASPTPTNEPVDEVSDLKFPISELGSCGDYKACLTFCDDPVNNAICVDFAKKNGFYKDDPVLTPTDDFLTKTKDVLGCNSLDACLAFCADPTNHEKCDEFAKSQGLGGGYVEDPDKPEFLEKAQEVLGCSDVQSCSTFCDDQANADKCDAFADEVGLLGGEVQEGPGGCNATGTCVNYCSDPQNFNACIEFVPEGTNFTGPGGCNSKETCRNYCEENSADCRSYAPGSNGVYVPAVCPASQDFGPGGVCTPIDKIQESGQCAQGGKYWNGSSCSDNAPPGIHTQVGGAYYQPRPEMGNCSTPGACYDFCKENPGKCASFDANASRPKDGYIPTLYYTPGSEVKFEAKAEMGGCDSPGKCYDFCKENPGKCGGFDSKAPRPVDTYVPGTYYTPSSDHTYFTPPATGFYVTPIYFTPPAGSNYTTPSYYTPGMYSSPSYYTPFIGSNYTTPNYYTPGTYYPTPANGRYPTPTYYTPTYYTPPTLASYNTPTYYSPAAYTSPYYYTPGFGSNYTTPTYNTPPAYTTPQYYTPYTGANYTTPTYYTPPAGSNYTTPTYPSPTYYYPTPTGGYVSPTYSYPSPDGSYTSPTYYSPGDSYYTPSTTGSYPTPGYVYPSPSGTGVDYYTPNSSYTYPSPTDGYVTPSYYSPYLTPTTGYSYPSPTYGTPESYPTPAYETPSYGTPESYPTPSYSYPSPDYPTPTVQGVSTERSLLERLFDYLGF